VQAVSSTGHVAVRATLLEAGSGLAQRTSIAGASAMVAITITDDGPGIPDDIRTRMFEPFVSGKSGGTGLGLPVVHRAIEAHRGVVLVDSLERGTRFTILLPAAAGAASTAPAHLPAWSSTASADNATDAHYSGVGL